MNPARSLAPELISGNIQTIWIYLLAPVFGALSVSFSYKFLAA
jgi:glycerol uptake facilitator-like aquaporin